MSKKKGQTNVSAKTVTKNLPREVTFLGGAKKELSNLEEDYKIRLSSILYQRLAYDIKPDVGTEKLKGKAQGTGLIELKIKSKDSVRCFYSVSEPGLVLVAIVFLKKQEDQATEEINLAVKRVKEYKQQKK